ncbi:putative membrane protein [Limihaloglobus sulfuriphilus]|uniref:Putative membrane protein n=1 Tax=Limihaloglobus sulfuriphilus TaxID=1851148 RepID=A0A1Q2MBE9_9BACT|nr:glutamine amidotransferase [Limihaloglobus sulfuriphilus]AQQ70001.1 putative membrane protein [Limihaloglobus sulfuriphilus]
MKQKVLYLGDTELHMQASYLAGVMSHCGIDYDYIPSASPISISEVDGYSAYILSDYPACSEYAGAFEAIRHSVEAGAGLLMIGGWESFNSLFGSYVNTPIEDVLPVVMARQDDRLNSAFPWFLKCISHSSVTAGLDFNSEMPAVAGLNRFTSKKDAEILLEAVQYRAHLEDNEVIFSESDTTPALVLGSFGKGRTSALAFDLAPHWAGGFVDWGQKRIDACAPGGDEIQVGEKYVNFVKNLLNWIIK